MTPAATPPALRTCGVRVPCSTSNLGAGFDCLGLAFDRYLDAGYEPGADELTVHRTGTLQHLDVDDSRDILTATFRADLARRGVEHVGGRLLVTSAIPVGRGLGSSGAAVVAGLALAAAACGDTLDRDAALASAVRVEGHPDNAAAALFGGLVAIAHGEAGVPLAMRLPLSDELHFVFAAPDMTVSTERARAALPQHVPHSAAVRNLGRLAALLYGLARADRAALVIGLTDELHVPYRMPLIPGAAGVIAAAQKAGAAGATISGSGSGIIAVCTAGHEDDVLDAMLRAFPKGATGRDVGAGSEGFVARPDTHGAQPRAFGTLRDVIRA